MNFTYPFFMTPVMPNNAVAGMQHAMPHAMMVQPMPLSQPVCITASLYSWMDDLLRSRHQAHPREVHTLNVRIRELRSRIDAQKPLCACENCRRGAQTVRRNRPHGDRAGRHDNMLESLPATVLTQEDLVIVKALVKAPVKTVVKAVKAIIAAETISVRQERTKPKANSIASNPSLIPNSRQLRIQLTIQFRRNLRAPV